MAAFWQSGGRGQELWRRLPAGIERLIALGTENYPRDVARRLRILNVFAYLIALFTFGYAIQYLVTDWRQFAPIILINAAIAAAVLLVPFSHRFGEIAGGLIISVTECLGLFALAYFLGAGSGLHIQYVVGCAACFFIFGLGRLPLTVVVIAICFALHMAVWAYFPTPRPPFDANPAFISSIYVSAVVTSFVLSSAIVYYAYRLAERAQAEMDALLRNILPESIVERLRADPEATIADSFASASVLFSDLRGFVTIAVSLGPARTVALLNRLMHELDRLATLHGVEKIKTIGDAYMAAAGVPNPVPDHALRLVRMGVDMLKVAEQMSREERIELQMRIGIASGPLLAGVIGAKRLTYDVWGDTVNLASRLENLGVPGRIQISSATRALIGDAVACESRGELDVKGFGAQEAFLVAGPARPSEAAVASRHAAGAVE